MVRFESDMTGWRGESGRGVRVIVHEDGPMAHAKAVEAMTGPAAERRRQYMPADAGWVGRSFRDWPEVTAAVAGVWPEGLAVIDELAARVRGAELPTPKSVRRRLKYREDEGDEFILERYENAAPPWRAMSPRKSIGPQVVSIAVQIGGLASRSAEELLWRGATALVLTDLLEDAGYLVELVAYSYPESASDFGTDGACLQAVVVKRPDDMLDRTLLANAVAPWYFRTLMFAGYALWPTGPTRGCGGQGTMPRHLLRHLTATAGAVVIENVWDHDGAVSRVRSALGQLAAGGEATCRVN
jgi:hypothetical protein